MDYQTRPRNGWKDFAPCFETLHGVITPIPSVENRSMLEYNLDLVHGTECSKVDGDLGRGCRW
jgi:hypothetical protein